MLSTEKLLGHLQQFRSVLCPFTNQKKKWFFIDEWYLHFFFLPRLILTGHRNAIIEQFFTYFQVFSRWKIHLQPQLCIDLMLKISTNRYYLSWRVTCK